jgi:hypothetical protein
VGCWANKGGASGALRFTYGAFFRQKIAVFTAGLSIAESVVRFCFTDSGRFWLVAEAQICCKYGLHDRRDAAIAPQKSPFKLFSLPTAPIKGIVLLLLIRIRKNNFSIRWMQSARPKKWYVIEFLYVATDC